MRYHDRALSTEILKAARHFPALIVTGPRRSGKTTLLRKTFPQATHVLLEDPDVVARVRADPRGFLDAIRTPALLDEMQNTPELFNYIRTRIDRTPEQRGQWILTGSQEAPLMRGVTESMAGRAAIYQLLPFSAAETPKVSILRGGFPEVVAMPSAADVWFRSYVQTYLERDVRAVSAIRDLSTFRRFTALLASRCGQILNKTDLAAPLGVSVPTLTQWLSILEITGQILIVPPFYENFGKRLIKSPKLYFVDTGLACHLLNIRDEESLRGSPFLGALFECAVASEIVKHRLCRGLDRALYFFRDQQGLEVDFVVDLGNKRLALIEPKATRTPMPAMAKSLLSLASVIGNHKTTPLVVHDAGPQEGSRMALAPGIEAVGWRQLAGAL
ncbi:MAG: ATP-binding protein [Acidobacteriota bacterium]